MAENDSILGKLKQHESVEFSFLDENRFILQLRIKNQKYANAYNSIMLDVIEHSLDILLEYGNIKVIIITGYGHKVFCSGADLNEIKNRSMIEGLNLKSKFLFDKLEALHIVTIAAVNGDAIGGGLELALACDIRVSSPNATFSLPELSYALIPAAGGIVRLPSIIGKGRAKEIILFRRKIKSHTALDWGLVSYVGDDYESKALELAKNVSQLDSVAVSLAKKSIDTRENYTQSELVAVTQALLYERRNNHI